MFENKVDTFLIRAGYTQMRNVGLSISQWLPCPFAIWALALDCDLVQSCYIVYCVARSVFEKKNRYDTYYLSYILSIPAIISNAHSTTSLQKWFYNIQCQQNLSDVSAQICLLMTLVCGFSLY